MSTAKYSHRFAETNMKEIKLGGLHAWLVWFVATTFVVFLFSIQTGYAVVNASMQQSTAISVAQVGIIAATYTWVFAFFQFYGGATLDQLGARKVLPASIVLVTIGVFIFANANNFIMLLVSQIFLAIGSCTGFVGAGYVGGKWFGMAKFGVMFGLVQVVAAATSAFSQNVIGVLLDYTTWRTLFNYIGFMGIILFIASLFWIHDPYPVIGKSNSILTFISVVTKQIFMVIKQVQVVLSAIYGALIFGTMLALGVVWAPKIVMAHGVSEHFAYVATSMLWVGLAFGAAIVPALSERIHSRKIPDVINTLIQISCLALLLYVPNFGAAACIILLFIFGFANSAHMLAFSSAGDIVDGKDIGTSAAIVNGSMFIVGGILMGLPGGRYLEAGALGLDEMAASQFANFPLLLAIILGLIVAILKRETHPQAPSKMKM